MENNDVNDEKESPPRIKIRKKGLVILMRNVATQTPKRFYRSMADKKKNAERMKLRRAENISKKDKMRIERFEKLYKCSDLSR